MSEHAWARLARTPLERGQLERFLGALTAGERRAFWTAVLLMDGRVTIGGVIDGYARLQPERRPVSDFAPRCAQCGNILPPRVGGRPRKVHDECRNDYLARRKREKRAGVSNLRG